MRRLGALLVSVLVIGLVGSTTTALAASTNLYLMADGEPSATMDLQPPGPGSPLSVTLQPSSLGFAEANPAKYQRWTYDMSGMTATVNNVTIWAHPLNPNGDRPFEFGVFVMDCAQSCTVLKTNSKVLQGTRAWTKVTLPVNTGPRQFDASHILVVKVTVLDSSAGDIAFAFGTSDYASALHLSALSPASTTTTTAPTTTTTAPTTTTTLAPTTTTSYGPTTTTSLPATTSTSPSATPPIAKAPPTTTTTTPVTGTTAVPSTSTSTTEQILAVAPPIPPPSTGEPLDFGDAGVMPEMVTLTGSADRPHQQAGALEAISHTGLRPAEGLAVVFAGAYETFSLYWEIAIALGLLMSLLLMIGFANLEIPRPRPDTSERIRRIS